MRGGYQRWGSRRPGFSCPPRPSRYQGDSGDGYDGQGQSDGKGNASSVHRSPFQPVGCSNGQQDAREECTAQQPTPVPAAIGAWQVLAIMGQVAPIPEGRHARMRLAGLMVPLSSRVYKGCGSRPGAHEASALPLWPVHSCWWHWLRWPGAVQSRGIGGRLGGANEQDFTSLSGDAGRPLFQEPELLDIIEIEG